MNWLSSFFSSTYPTSSKDLQRKIFLNTMRSVYPHSLQIHYIPNAGNTGYQLVPVSAKMKCQVIEDEIWKDVTTRLDELFAKHVQKR